MPQSWALVAAPLAAGAVLLRGVLRKGGKRKAEEGGKEAEGGAAFACERVCTSESLLRRLGSLAKEATPNTCVTVCGLSSVDACTEACQRAVCSGTHQVPAWNDSCLKRCSTECLKRSGLS